MSDEVWRRDDSWLRDKWPEEKWPRFAAEIPQELADELDAVQRKVLGVNAQAASRAGLVRGALREWLEKYDPEPAPAIDSTAEEILTSAELEDGTP